MTSPASIAAPPRKETSLLISGMAIAWAMARPNWSFTSTPTITTATSSTSSTTCPAAITCSGDTSTNLR